MAHARVTAATPGRARRNWPRVAAYAYLAPAGVLLLAFHVYPLFYGAYVSLFNWGLTRQRFVGLATYGGVLHDGDFWRSMLVTVYYVAGVVPLEIVLGFVIAYLLAQKIRGRAAYRLVYFLPYITSMVAMGLVWSWIFNANFGMVNSVLRLLHLPTQRWLLEPRGVLALLAPGPMMTAGSAGPSLALVCVMAVTIWYYTGFHVVVYLAGLTAIPAEVHEAAVGWRRGLAVAALGHAAARLSDNVFPGDHRHDRGLSVLRNRVRADGERGGRGRRPAGDHAGGDAVHLHDVL